MNQFFELIDLLNELNDVIDEPIVPVLIVDVMGNIAIGYRGESYQIMYEVRLGETSDMINAIQEMNKLIVKTRK